MKLADLQTIATRRVFNLEKKNRVQTRLYIEKELLDIMNREGINCNDFANMALQEFTTGHGIPLVAMRVDPDGTLSFINLSHGDILNLALGDLLTRKGYARPGSSAGCV